MIEAGAAPRWLSAGLVALALLTSDAVPGPSDGLDSSSRADIGAIASGPPLVATTSDRPDISRHAMVDHIHRLPLITSVAVPALEEGPATLTGSVRSSRSLLAAGPASFGLAGRGPPSVDDD
jgi:hypothetical protein